MTFKVLRPHPWIAISVDAELDADPADPKIAALLTDGYLELVEPPLEPVQPPVEPPAE